MSQDKYIRCRGIRQDYDNAHLVQTVCCPSKRSQAGFCAVIRYWNGLVQSKAALLSNILHSCFGLDSKKRHTNLDKTTVAVPCEPQAKVEKLTGVHTKVCSPSTTVSNDYLLSPSADSVSPVATRDGTFNLLRVAYTTVKLMNELTRKLTRKKELDAKYFYDFYYCGECLGNHDITLLHGQGIEIDRIEVAARTKVIVSVTVKFSVSSLRR